MPLFKSKQQKELEKKMLIKKTVTQMQKHIAKLEAQKRVFIDAAKRAKSQNLQMQINLAITGLKMTLAQQKRAQEMLLNFEITSQMKDMTMMTSEFLGGMSVLSREMVKLTDDKQFAKVQLEFEKAMAGAELQTERMEGYLDSSADTFASASGPIDAVTDEEINRLLDNDMSTDMTSSDQIDKELAALKAKLGG
ncbi:MAG: hypothetical protein LBM78_00345 [Clostridiales bacterium]|jgi:hypothetical protein|nr:hypothetical protein [Clostridiales bacterium]